MVRRSIDQGKAIYSDRYSSTIFFFLVLISALNIVDSLFTMMILDLKGREFNPIVQSAIDIYGSNFWIWKYWIVSLSCLLLCLHSRLKLVKGLIITLSSFYVAIVFYQIVLLTQI